MTNKHIQLSHLSLLKISGDDAVHFLQGQLTNDINKLKSTWHYSGYCSPKGRLLALLHVWRCSSTVYALVDTSIRDSIVKRLRMYVMRSKVVIEPLENSKIVGLKNIEPLKKHSPELAIQLSQPGVTMAKHEATKHPLFALRISNTAVSKSKDGSERIILIDLDQEGKSVTGLNTNASLSTDQWLAQDINQGLASITDKSSELFIPQMLNLDIIDGISFKKGCYTGQEIVARMHYLGKLKQRMFVCKLSAEGSTCNAGDKIFADVELTKPVGHLVTYVDNHSQVLAVLRVDITSSKADLSIDSEKPIKKNIDIKMTSKTAEVTLFLSSETSLTPLTIQPYPLPIK